MLTRAVTLGADAGRWAGAMVAARGIEGVRVLQGFLALARKHPAQVINRASRVALDTRCFRLRPVRQLCTHYAQNEDEPFTDDHPIIRPLAEYQQVVTQRAVSFRMTEQQEVKT